MIQDLPLTNQPKARKSQTSSSAQREHVVTDHYSILAAEAIGFLQELLPP